MVAFHTQRLKDSIGGGFLQNLNVTAEKISSLLGQMSVKPEQQSNFSFNDYSQLVIIIKRKITLLFRFHAHLT